MQDINDDVIELNVGGQKMTTKRSTLCQVEGSLLASMFSGRWEGSMPRDKDGQIFLDFNPKYFVHILDYLRAKAISNIDKPATLTKVGLNQVKNFHKLIEYLGLGEEMLPQITELFKEHSQGITLEENGTVAVFYPRSKQTTTHSGYPQQILLYSLPQNEFVFGQNVYEVGIVRLKLKIEAEFGEDPATGYICIGVVPTQVTPGLTYSILKENFFGWKINCTSQEINIHVEDGCTWSYPKLTTIELILDCDARMLYLTFHDGKQLNLKITRWNTWRLLVKLNSNQKWHEQGINAVSMRVCILESIKEY